MPEFFRLAKRGREAAGTSPLDEIVDASGDRLTTNDAVVGDSFRWFANAFSVITEISSGTRRRASENAHVAPIAEASWNAIRAKAPALC